MSTEQEKQNRQQPGGSSGIVDGYAADNGAGVDELRRAMVQEGVPFETAAIAAGLAAEYAQAAYVKGFNRGFNQGHAKASNKAA